MRHEITNNILHISLEENLVSTIVQEVREQVQELLAGQLFQCIELDITKSDLIDSQGLNLIIGLYKEATKKSIRFSIRGCSASNDRLFTIFKLKGLFQITH